VAGSSGKTQLNRRELVKKILIIEDDSSFAEELKSQLSAQHQVEVCPDGQSGYYAIYEYKPDAVLLDLTIGQMGAVSLVGKIKAQKQFNRLPIFVLADTKTMGLADEALAAGANEAFLKDQDDAVTRVMDSLAQFMTPSLAKQIRRTTDVPVAAPAVFAHAGEAPVAVLNAPPSVSGVSPRSVSIYSAPPIPPNANFQQAAALFAPPRNLPTADEANLAGQVFLDTYGQKAHVIRKDFISYRTAQGPDRKVSFERFVKGVSELKVEARDSGFAGLAMYLSAIEVRVTQLLSCLDVVTAPSLQILAAALDVLAALDNHLAELRPLNNMTPHALVVDDENVSRRALCLGLEKAKIKATSVDNPDSAIQEAEGTPFDIIFLDVELPKMNGFALCARIRLFAAHRKTPILFVTSLSDMKSRASSRVSGGNQFLTKPLNYPELTVNAWTLVIRKRILEDGRTERTRG
jgi:DNA-binding response OmpR family regulator